MKLLVTGGCGFIGSNFIRTVLSQHPDWKIVNLDALTYASCTSSLSDVENLPGYSFVRGDIRDAQAVVSAVHSVGGVDAVVNFAAESHVDNSIKNPDVFVDTNVVGTLNLLRIAAREGCRFLQVSTDEVYGSLGKDDPPFTESSQIDPNSPYSASKASADHFVLAWKETYGTDVVITRCSNNYGPYQFPEKLIPRAITNLLSGMKVPVYGDGSNIRDWIHVSDHCMAVLDVLQRGESGQVYNIGADSERSNLEVVRGICSLLGLGEGSYEFVTDRPGHDWRYGMDSSRISRELGWNPTVSFEEGLERTVRWYVDNPGWWTPLRGML